jgi:hypothetical protein
VRTGQRAQLWLVAIPVVLGIAAITNPSLAVIALATLVVTTALFVVPKPAFLFFVVFLALQPALVNLAGGRESALGAALQRVDEVIVLAAALRIIVVGPGGVVGGWRSRWFVLLGAFLTAGVLSGLVHHVPIVVLALGAFLAVKFHIFLLVTLTIDWTEADARRLVGSLLAIAPALLITAVLLSFAPMSVRSMFEDPAAVSDNAFERGGLVAMSAPFSHPGQFGWAMAACGCFAIAAISHRLPTRTRASSGLAASIVGMIASLRRKPLLALPLAAFGSLTAGLERRRRMVALSAAALVVATVALIARSPIAILVSDTVNSYFDPLAPTAARTVLYLTGVDLANRSFPFGAGFGRFGGYASQLFYSPVYDDYGISALYGLSPTTPYYLQDTYWPHVVGETGWIGGLVAAGMIVLLWRGVIRVALSHRDKWVQAMALGAGILLLEAVLESAAAPIFEGTLFAFAIAVPVGMALVLGAMPPRDSTAALKESTPN